MFNNIENLKIISSLHSTNKPSSKIKNRPTHSFFIRVRGSILYDLYDKRILANEGEMVFMPKGSSYTYKTFFGNEMYTSINFQCDFVDHVQPTLYSLENFHEADYISNHFSDMWNFGSQAEKYKCMSLFYSLLSYLSATESSSYSEKSKFKTIEPAIDYLKEHIYDCSLKTDKLHRLCGISNTYFRQIFISRFGVKPQEYIISKRLSHAKSIIDSGDFDTVKEIALSVGYSDPLYFSKAFKKMYGNSPLKMDETR